LIKGPLPERMGRLCAGFARADEQFIASSLGQIFRCHAWDEVGDLRSYGVFRDREADVMPVRAEQQMYFFCLYKTPSSRQRGLDGTLIVLDDEFDRVAAHLMVAGFEKQGRGIDLITPDLRVWSAQGKERPDPQF